MKDTAANMITKAKVQLILDQPFYAMLALRMKFQPSEAVPTAATDGVSILYNPGFIEGLTIDEVKGLIAHEVTHVSSLHHTRRNGRDMERWNMACDYAINPLIEKSDLKLPPGALINPAYSGKSAEEIFSLLPPPQEKPQDKQQPGDGQGQGAPDPGKCGAVQDAPVKSESERTQVEAEVKQAIAQAATIAKQQGKLPAHLERLIHDVLAPAVNWREVLARFLDQIDRNDYTWTKPNKRYLHAGLYMPALESLTVGKFVLIVDTSGSVDEDILRQFAGEISEIAQAWNVGFTVLHVDTHVNHVQEFEPGDTIEPRGGGGTDFRPGFDWIAENEVEPAAAIYLTDGHCNSYPQQAPQYPVLWGVYGDMARTFEPKFGETVPILSK